MTEVNLKRLLKKSRVAIEPLLNTFHLTIQIEDIEGTVLLGESNPEQTGRYPILLSSNTIGWVAGGAQGELIAQLFSYLAERELEMKTLAHEALEKYREINLLYNLSEKLNASLDVKVVAQTVLSEVRKLIPATRATILLLNLKTGEFEPDSTFSDPEHNFTVAYLMQVRQGIAGTVLQTGKGEIINDVTTDHRYRSGSQQLSSLICVPLKTEKGAIGVLNVSSQTQVNYTAQHLKLLNTLASQASQAIENACIHQQQIAAAKAREAKLKQQLQELRVEVDEAKRSRQVAEITETEYFQQLQQRVGQLRRRRG